MRFKQRPADVGLPDVFFDGEFPARLVFGVILYAAAGREDNGIFIGGDEQNFYRLHSYAEKHYSWAMR